MIVAAESCIGEMATFTNASGDVADGSKSGPPTILSWRIQKMGMIGSNVPLAAPNDGICDCAWGGNQCPNAAAVVYVNKQNAGFGIFCEPHSQNYEADQPAWAQLHTKMPWSKTLVDDLTALALAAGLI
jgi:hypothetical protein